MQFDVIELYIQHTYIKATCSYFIHNENAANSQVQLIRRYVRYLTLVIFRFHLSGIEAPLKPEKIDGAWAGDRMPRAKIQC